MLPPTMIDAPISEITPPKPAITPAMSGSRASFMRIQTICGRVAPSARIWSFRAGGRLCIAPMVTPITIGVAMIACAATIAAGV